MDDTRPIPGHGRSGDTRPLYNPRSGQTELETQLLEHTDPALLRLHLRRLQGMVDKLVDRETAEPTGHADLVWALQQLELRIAAGEQWGRTRDLGALVVAAGVVAWTGAWTAVVAAVAWTVTP